MNSNQIALKTREEESKHANVCQQTGGSRTILPDKPLGKLQSQLHDSLYRSSPFPRDVSDALLLRAGQNGLHRSMTILLGAERWGREAGRMTHNSSSLMAAAHPHRKLAS